MIEKRKAPKITEDDIYKLSPIQDFIEKERRHDELDRLYEVKQQKRAWNITVFSAFFLVFILLILSYVGYINNVR